MALVDAELKEFYDTEFVGNLRCRIQTLEVRLKHHRELLAFLTAGGELPDSEVAGLRQVIRESLEEEKRNEKA